MKIKLFSAIAWLALVLCYTQVSAQADPTLTGVDTSTNDVTVTNLGDAEQDISSYWVCLGPGQYRQLSALTIVSGDFMLSANESVTFDFPLIAGENADGAGGIGFFTTNSFGSTNPSVYIDFMQWGAPNQDRSAQAVTAGIWNSAAAFISCPSPYTTNGELGGNPTAWNEADAGIIGIDIDATNTLNVNGTTSIDSEFQATICVDGRPDPIVVFHDTPTEGRTYSYVITDAVTNIILGITNSNEISLDDAGQGTCQIWGWNYSGLNGGADFIGGPLQDLRDADCSDVSDQSITIVREEADGGTVSIDLDATGNPNGTTTFNGDTEAVICVDGQMDPIVVVHENPGAENLSYRYVITDAATGLILNVVATNSISLDPAGPGTCEIWGWSYRGVPNNGLDQIGEPLSALDDLDCSDISDNAITVIREEADGGTVSINTNSTSDAQGTTTIDDENNVTILVGDGIANPIVVEHINNSPNLSYRYVITDVETGNILNVVNTNSIDLDGVVPGTCGIWGWSYRGVPGNGLDQIGQPLSSLDNLDCSDISENSVTVTRVSASPVEDVIFTTTLSGMQENPAALTNASGSVTATLSGNELVVTGSFENLSGDFDANIAGGAHVHRAIAGRNGDIEFLLNTTVAPDLRSGTYEAANNTFTLTSAQVDALNSRELYINIHTSAFPGGELRGQLLIDSDFVYQTTLLGSNEFPQVNTTGEGNMLFELNGDQLTVSGSFDGLSSEIRVDLANGAHIHDNFAGRNGPVIFPLNPTYDDDNQGATFEAANNIFTLSADQLTDLAEQGLYINIHSVDNPGGELRGQIVPLSSSVFGARLTGAQEVIVADTAANGRIFLSNDGNGNISVSGSFNDLSADLNTELAGGIHVHLAVAGRNGGIEFILTPDTAPDNRNAIIRPSENTFALSESLVNALFTRNLYVNVHSLDFVPGEIRGQLQPLVQTYLGTTLSGQNEVQPITTTANGNVQLELSGLNLIVTGAFNDLIGDFDENIAGGSHLHLSDATGNGGIEVLINATTDANLRGGIYSADNNTFTITEAQREFLLNDEIYLNIHSTEFPSGELRGQILVSENNFPVANFAITSPADGADVSIGGDTTYQVTYDATTDPNGNLIVYTYQLATDSAFENSIINEKVGEALNFSNDEAIRDALIAEGVAMDDTVTYYQRILASDGSVSSPSVVQTINFTLECAANASDIVFSTDNLNDTTSVSDDGLSAVICIDSVADPIGVTMVNPEDSEGANAGWIITDLATNEILGLPASGPFDLNGAGTGTCQIWYLRYEDGLAGMEVGNLLSDLEGCFDLSNPLDVIREEADGGTVAIDLDATGNPNGTTTFNGDTEAVICVDGQMDPIVVVHENPGSENLSYRYVITDAATGLILNVVATNSISLDPAGPGTCEIWGWSYRGVPNNGLDQIGEPLSALDDLDCSDISDNAITVIREEANGGTVAIDLDATGNPNGTTTFNGDTEAVICVDGQMDPIVVVHENPGSENLSYRYVITDAATGLILNVVATNSISLDPAGPGTCEIWGWSYRGVPNNGLDQIGEPLSALDDLDCSDISDNAITVIREEADGGTVSIDLEATVAAGGNAIINSDTEAVICIDATADPIVVAHVNDAPNLSFRYVITDAETGLILNVVNTNSIDLNGVAPGTCEIWGWSYRGVPGNGLDQIGEPLSALDDLDCSDISDNAVTVIRQEHDIDSEIAINLDETGNPNGTTTFDDEFNAVICGDGQGDALVIDITTSANDLPYSLVVYDIDTFLITDIIDVEGTSAIVDLNGEETASFEILGVSGILPASSDDIIGSDIEEFADLLFESECGEFSITSIVVLREVADGGDVSIDVENTDNAGGTTIVTDENNVTIQVNDGVANPIVVQHENPGAENLSYRYVITDAETGLILNVVNSTVIDLEDAGVGVCEIWGWSYRGVPNNGLDQIGESLSALDDLECSDISNNAIIVNRAEVLSIADEALEMSISVYPNPTVDYVNITIAQSSQELSVTVYDLLGKRVMVQDGDQGEMRIDVSDLPSGMYLLEVVDTANNARAVERLIKR